MILFLLQNSPTLEIKENIIKLLLIKLETE